MMANIKEFFLMNIVIPVVDTIMGMKIKHWYKEINRLNSLSRDEITEWQNRKFRDLIRFAYEHTVYYKEVIDKSGYSIDDFNSTKDICLLPILTKEIIRQRYSDIIPDNIDKISHRKRSTGGSTGEPLHFIIDENTWGYVTAAKIYAWQTTGFHYGEPFLSFGSSSLFRVNKKNWLHDIYYKLRNAIALNGMNMEDSICRKYLEIARKKRVKYIYGYASSIYILASYVKKHNVKYKLNAVFTTSEVLTPEYRQVIEEAFDTKVMDCYGAHDGGITAFEIERGSYFVGYNTFCEVENPSKISTLYCSNLIDFAFPMLRYEVGDAVVMDTTENTHYNGQIIKKIEGRSADIIRLKNGHVVTNPGFATLLRQFNIEAYQVLQSGDNNVCIKLKTTPDFKPEEEAKIIDTTKKYAGDDCEITIQYIDRFEPLENGKRRFIMSK
jgi:protein capK